MRLIEDVFGLGQIIRTQQVPRSIKDDINFLLNSNARSSVIDTLASKLASPNTTNSPTADSSPIVNVPAGPVGIRISSVATQLIGTENTNYYHDARVACASFVSTVLQKAGVFADGTFQTWCPTLESSLLSHGAQLVVPIGTRVGDAHAATQLQAGDIILFHDSGTRFKHAMVYTGSGIIVGTSSSKYQVRANRILGYKSYTFYAAFRFPS